MVRVSLVFLQAALFESLDLIPCKYLLIHPDTTARFQIQYIDIALVTFQAPSYALLLAFLHFRRTYLSLYTNILRKDTQIIMINGHIN